MPDKEDIQTGLGADGDAFYEMLMQAHEQLTEAESHAFNMRLVLLMANKIGDLETIEDLFSRAGAGTKGE